MKKIKFVNKSTVDEYVHSDQKLVAWGGDDSWEYEFIEERPKETQPEPDESVLIINGNNHETSTSEEEDLRPAIPVENLVTNSFVSNTSATIAESEHRVNLNTLANVTYSGDKDKGMVLLSKYSF